MKVEMLDFRVSLSGDKGFRLQVEVLCPRSNSRVWENADFLSGAERAAVHKLSCRWSQILELTRQARVYSLRRLRM